MYITGLGFGLHGSVFIKSEHDPNLNQVLKYASESNPKPIWILFFKPESENTTFFWGGIAGYRVPFIVLPLKYCKM